MSEMIVHQVKDRVYIHDPMDGWVPAIVEQVGDNEIYVQVTPLSLWDRTATAATTRATIPTATTTALEEDHHQHQHQQQELEEQGQQDGTNTTLVVSNQRQQSPPPAVEEQERKQWVQLNEYYNHHLPLQNLITTTAAMVLMKNEYDDEYDEYEFDGGSIRTQQNIATRNKTALPTSTTRLINDVHELEYIHEAELLYQIKLRHCCRYTTVTDVATVAGGSTNTVRRDYSNNYNNPYIRCYGSGTNSSSSRPVNPMLFIAINPSSFSLSNLPSIYTIQQQELYTHPYIRYIIVQQQQHKKQQQQQQERNVQSDSEISAPSFDEKKEDDNNNKNVLLFGSTSTNSCTNQNNNKSSDDHPNGTTTTTTMGVIMDNTSTMMMKKNDMNYMEYLQQEQLVPHIYEISAMVYYNVLFDYHYNSNNNSRNKDNTTTRTTTRNQYSIIMTGESGSGKTETSKHLLQHLLNMSIGYDHNKNHSDHYGSHRQQQQPQQSHMLNDTSNSMNPIASVITTSTFVLEAFGNASTMYNSNSTRFGRITKLQYYSDSDPNRLVDPSPVVGADDCCSPVRKDPTSTAPATVCFVGCTHQTYMLETNRVVASHQYGYGERNFHIFYQMLSASSSVKFELLGPDWKEAVPQDFKYLQQNVNTSIVDSNNGSRHSSSMTDAKNWTITLKALIVLGWDGTKLECLMRALGIILLTGNIDFHDDNDHESMGYHHRNEPKPTNITQTADLIMLSTSLGIPAVELELALTHRTVQTAHDLLLVPLSADQAYEACMALSKLLYTKIFDGIVRQINDRTSLPISSYVTSTSDPIDTMPVGGVYKTIALIDIFGFENFHVNHFEQFCINYANERLQNKYVMDSLSQHKVEYGSEGIILPDWKIYDNSNTLDLFDGPDGLIKILNDQCTLLNQSTDDYVALIKQVHHTHDRFIDEDRYYRATNFGIYHFAEPVVYDASKFVEANANKVPDFLINVVATSTNSIIAHELGDVMKERTESAISQRKAEKSVVDYFQKQLKDFMLYIEGSLPQYVICIKPSDAIKGPKKIDHQVVLRQLRSTGIVSAIEQSREMYPNKLSFETVARRFSCLLSKRAATSIDDMDLIDRAQVILSSVFAPIIEKYRSSEFAMPFVCGHAKVFFRPGALEVLESERQALVALSVICIQRTTRRSISRKRYQLIRKGFTKMQALFRCRVARQDYKLSRASIIKVQSSSRMSIHRQKFLRIKCAVVSIQRQWPVVQVKLKMQTQQYLNKKLASLMISRWLEGIVLKRQLKVKNDSAFVISSWWSARCDRLAYILCKKAATTIAAWIRAIMVSKQYRHLKKATTIVASRRRLQLSARKERAMALEEMKQKILLNERIRAVTKLQFFVRSKQKSSCSRTSTDSCRSFVNDTNVNDNDLILAPRSIVEQVTLYKRQIKELKSDITLLTSEAEFHKLEVEAEFEDRLADYEEEVLQLKRTIDNLNDEKISLKDELAASVENVQHLKEGIQSMHAAHREYLNKVMRAIENANREHQVALEFVRQEKEQKVRELTQEMERIQREYRKDSSRIDDDTQNNIDKIYHLARKIEKVTSPSYIATLSKKVRKIPSKEDYIEEKFSGRVRHLLYKIEDIAALPQNVHQPDEYVQSLQQQLIGAKSEIERLSNQMKNDSSTGRRGLKKFFER